MREPPAGRRVAGHSSPVSKRGEQKPVDNPKALKPTVPTKSASSRAKPKENRLPYDIFIISPAKPITLATREVDQLQTALKKDPSPQFKKM